MHALTRCRTCFLVVGGGKSDSALIFSERGPHPWLLVSSRRCLTDAGPKQHLPALIYRPKSLRRERTVCCIWLAGVSLAPTRHRCRRNQSRGLGGWSPLKSCKIWPAFRNPGSFIASTKYFLNIDGCLMTAKATVKCSSNVLEGYLCRRKSLVPLPLIPPVTKK